MVHEFKLEGLDIQSSKELLKIGEIDDNTLKSIHTIVQGHPLALELMDSIDALESQKDFNAFIEEEILHELTEPEKILLSTASVYRYPVEARAFFSKQKIVAQSTVAAEVKTETVIPNDNGKTIEINYDTISKLIKRSLIQEHPGKHYDTHDLVSEFFYERLTPLDKKKYHTSAADYYAEFPENLATIEMLHHLLMAGEYEAAARLAIDEGPALIYQGYVEFMNILDEFDTESLPEHAGLWEEILALKGDAALRMGAFDHALEYYEDNLELLTQQDKTSKIAEVYDKMGKAHGEMGEWERTINFHKKSLELFRKQKNKKGMARAYNNLGLAYRNIEDNDSAIKNYKKAIELLTELGERIGIALTYINLGKISESNNDLKSAKKYFQQSLELTKKTKFYRGMINSLNALAFISMKNQQWTKALKELKESLAIAEKIDDIQNLVTICNHLGDVYEQTNQNDQAISHFHHGIRKIEENMLNHRPSKSHFKATLTNGQNNLSSILPTERFPDSESIKIEFKDRLGELYTKVGNLYRTKNDWVNGIKAHEKSLGIYKELKNRKAIAKLYLDLGIDFEESGKLHDAIANYNNALKILQSLNEYAGMVVAYTNIGKIFAQQGQTNSALDYFNKSLKLSKQLNFKVGIERANKLIKNLKSKK
jgi:tetratricopeptide (TPR) repeat protein